MGGWGGGGQKGRRPDLKSLVVVSFAEVGFQCSFKVTGRLNVTAVKGR